MPREEAKARPKVWVTTDTVDKTSGISGGVGQEEEHSEDRSDSVDRVEKQKCDGYRNAEENGRNRLAVELVLQRT